MSYPGQVVYTQAPQPTTVYVSGAPPPYMAQPQVIYAQPPPPPVYAYPGNTTVYASRPPVAYAPQPVYYAPPPPPTVYVQGSGCYDPCHKPVIKIRRHHHHCW
eukprot:TRINITY_DN1325_c0_g4_i2.p2 TRINITY_DN1325_c0_g4~~TRINITY_DN1325_c0_g4_i2.p2  ORF type:complete len:103 (+),score=17.75 TRINITY_DN1325_c0_g4_i2:119-427(+)